MTRIVVMSDTHMLHHRLVVPDGDIVVHCGDWTGEDTLSDYEDFFAWFAALPHEHKVLTAGNHESLMQNFGKTISRRIPDTVTYLMDAAITVAGLQFWGSPRTPGFPWMAFTHQAADDSESFWEKIPDDTDVLVTHGPPYGILDRSYSGQHIGDTELLKRVEQVRPKLHLFGHVHDQNGWMERFGTNFINAAIGDDEERLNLSALIRVVDIDDQGRVSVLRRERSSTEEALAAGLVALRAAGLEPTAWAHEQAAKVISGELTPEQWEANTREHYGLPPK